MSVFDIILCTIYAMFLLYMFASFVSSGRFFYLSRLRTLLLRLKYHIKDDKVEKL